MSAAQGFGEVETKETPAAFDVSKFLANNCEVRRTTAGVDS